jgi:hypothetical protein
MGRRREPRKEMQASVRIFGTDRSGQVFSEKAVTVNISQQGAELSGVQAVLKIDEIIGLSYGKNRVHFRVKWVANLARRKQVMWAWSTLLRKNLYGISHYLLPHQTITSQRSRSSGKLPGSSATTRWNFILRMGPCFGQRLQISASADVTLKWRSLCRPELE